MMTPSPGTKLYEGTFTSGLVLESVGGRRAEPYTCTTATTWLPPSTLAPGKKQFNLLTAYLYFYNPSGPPCNPAKPKDKTGIKLRRHATRRHVRPCPLHPPHLRLGPPPHVPEKSTASAPPQSSIPMHPSGLAPPTPLPPRTHHLRLPHRRRGCPLTPPGKRGLQRSKKKGAPPPN